MPDSNEHDVDEQAFGRGLRAARIANGFDRMTDLAGALGDRFGCVVSARSLYAVERGEQLPSLDVALCLAAVLGRELSEALLLPSVRADVARSLAPPLPRDTAAKNLPK